MARCKSLILLDPKSTKRNFSVFPKRVIDATRRLHMGIEHGSIVRDLFAYAPESGSNLVPGERRL